jgi:hypothetical protein
VNRIITADEVDRLPYAASLHLDRVVARAPGTVVIAATRS